MQKEQVYKLKNRTCPLQEMLMQYMNSCKGNWNVIWVSKQQMTSIKHMQ